MKVRIATFNAENLFARFKFKGKRVKQGNKYVYRPYTASELAQVAADGWDVDATKFDRLTGTDRRITAAAIRGADADILGLQEIEAMDTLKKFVSEHLSNENYKYKILIDANDPRFIDVALLVRRKFSIAYIRTHQFERTANNKAYVFSRDCLEVGVQLSQNTVLPVFVNHFKSMMDGRQETMARRKEQSELVAKILRERFGPNPGNKAWVVLGDLNDYLPSSGLQPLVGQPWAVNVVDRVPNANDRWTHYWDDEEEYRQLDYILLSKSLADANPNAVPEIERRGLPKRAARYTGPWFAGVGQNEPKASDHCPLAIEINV
jgi:endonuclease/exonuclease/phosphatase family metal-dependent hydrolase